MQHKLSQHQQLSTSHCVLALVVLCLLHASVVAQQAAAPAGVGIAGSWPSSLSQYVQTTVRVTLNTSACGQWGQDAGEDAQLVLQHVTARGGSLAFKSSSLAAAAAAAASGKSSAASADCTSFDFPVLLDGTSKHGKVSARLLLPRLGLDLRLQEPIIVHVPLLLSVATPSISVSADSKPFAVGVSLNMPAPAGGVTVQLKLGQDDVAKVEPWSLQWPEGTSGRRDFTVTLVAAPEHGVLTGRLSNPSGEAVVHPSAAAVEVVVQSPVVSFTTNLGYYRGLNASTAPRLMFKMTGASAFPTQFAFSTYLLPGSRPSMQPCHPLAPSCSVADQEAVDNVTITGSRYITPGQGGIPPVELPVTWGRLPPEAELRVGLHIVSISNCKVAKQAGEAAAIIFGTPPGHCPPGAVLATGTGDLISHGNRSRSSWPGAHISDRPTYTQVAALQELALVLDHQDESHEGTFGAANNADRRRLLSAASSSGGRNSSQGPSSTGATNSTCSSCTRAVFKNKTAASSSRAVGVGAAVMPSTVAAAKAAILPVATSAINSSEDSSASSSRTLDLDPPFRPLVDRYIALLPPGSDSGHLMLSSSRWGDVVVVDTTACGELDSARYTVAWDQGQQLWREYYLLAGQRTPCWIRVHVFTRQRDGGSAAAPPARDSSSEDWINADSEHGPGLKDPSAGANMRPMGMPLSAATARRPLQARADAGDQPTADAVNASGSNGSVGLADIWSSNGTSSTSSSPSVWDLPTDFVLYRSYTIRFVPLRPPEQLSLRAITFSNNATVVVACGVPAAYEHLFVLPRLPQLTGAKNAIRPSSIMSSNYAAASSQAAGQRRNSTSTRTPAAPGSSFTQLPSNAEEASENVADAASSSDGSRKGPPGTLTAAPGVDVQVAYLLMKPHGSNSSSTAEDVAAAAKIPNRLRMQQFSVFDMASNKTVMWSRFTGAECAQDHYILLPMAQLKPDMNMVPELVDPEGFDAGVKIAMSAAAVALPSGLDTNSSGSGTAAASSSSAGSSGSQLGVPSEGSSSVSSWLLAQKFQGGGFSDSPVAASAAAAAVDGGKGFGGAGPKNLGEQVWCSKNSSSGVRTGFAQGAGAEATSGSAGSSSSDLDCRLQLPGLTAELPIILTADEGRSSRTYTMLLYSNATAATAVHDMVLPQEAAAGSARTGGSAGGQAADAAALTVAYFASRPAEWPKSPAQSSQCNVCPNGTYSLRTDALECKVCPPGKYAASPFSTTCLYCPPGSFSYYWGAPTCRTCLPGTYAASAGALFCDICRDGTTTRTEGATQCEVMVAGGSASRLDDVLGSADVAILLSFGLLLDGTNLESVSRSLTGINGSSEGIVGVLVRGDTATALNISLGSVQVLAVQQIGSRQLLVSVSAALPVTTDQAAAAAAQQDLSADPLIQRLIDDPNTFLRTTQTLGAESASVQDITTQMTQRAKWRHQLQLHAILWPTLAAFLLLVGLGSWGWRRRRRRQLQLAQIATGRSDPAAAVAGGSLPGLFGSSLQQRGARGATNAGPGWYYGDGFMVGAGGAAAAGDDLARMSVNSSDAGDVGVRHGGRGVAGAWRDLQRLLSSRIRIVFKVQGSAGSAGGRSACNSPVGTQSPGKSSCGASEADSMERGADEYRVRVLVGSEDGSSSSRDVQASASSLHQQDLGLREESFAARLRAKQQQQLQ